MQKLKFLIKLSLAYLSRFKAIIIIGIILGTLSFFSFTQIFPYVSSLNAERIGVTGRYRTEELPDFIVNMISDGLTQISANHQPLPNLSSNWEVLDQGKTWVFHIDENVFWQDGRKVVTEDIQYSFKDVEVEKAEKSVTFKLKEPFSPFPSVVAKPIFKKGLLGTGNWEVKKASFIGGFVHELLLIDKDQNRKLYRFYPTAEGTKTAFKLGQIDKIVEADSPHPFDTWDNINIEKVPNNNQVVAIFFNVQDKLLSEKSFRQALIYAIDKSKFESRALSPVSPASWAFNPQVKDYPYDINRSQEVIKGLPDELKSDMKVKLSSSPQLLSTAEEVAKNWKAVGVDAQVQVANIVPTEFQAFITILDIPEDPDQYSLWHTTQTDTNISKYSNLRIDKLLEDGRSNINSEERRALYLDFQRYLLEDVPAGFLYHPTYYTISRN